MQQPYTDEQTEQSLGGKHDRCARKSLCRSQISFSAAPFMPKVCVGCPTARCAHGEYSDLCRRSCNYGNGGCDGFSPNFPLIRQGTAVLCGTVPRYYFFERDDSTWLRDCQCLRCPGFLVENMMPPDQSTGSVRGHRAYEGLCEDGYFFRMRMALNTAMSATPTSPNTASHIPAIPSAPRMRKMPLIPSAMMMF